MTPATQPTLDLNDLLAEEAELQLARFDLATALRLGGLLMERGLREGLPIGIEIARGGQVVFFALLPGSSPDNAGWTRRKRAVVERFHRSSLYMTEQCRQQGRTLHERYGLRPEDFAASGGGFPVAIRGTGVVGAAAVSGLRAVEDHAMIADALRQMLGEETASAS